jgi:hypothetical protein
MVDAADLKSASRKGSVGSSPSLGILVIASFYIMIHIGGIFDIIVREH